MAPHGSPGKSFTWDLQTVSDIQQSKSQCHFHSGILFLFFSSVELTVSWNNWNSYYNFFIVGTTGFCKSYSVKNSSLSYYAEMGISGLTKNLFEISLKVAVYLLLLQLNPVSLMLDILFTFLPHLPALWIFKESIKNKRILALPFVHWMRTLDCSIIHLFISLTIHNTVVSGVFFNAKVQKHQYCFYPACPSFTSLKYSRRSITCRILNFVCMNRSRHLNIFSRPLLLFY